MRQAKINVIRNYLLVGVTEELEDFLFALEALLPEFFKGVLNVYKAPGWMRVCVCVFFFSICMAIVLYPLQRSQLYHITLLQFGSLENT